MVLSPTKKTITKPSSKDETLANRRNSGSIKLQRGSKPLRGNRLYLDIKNHATASKLESTVKSFGGVVDPFLGREVNLVVTDRSEWGGSINAGAVGSPRYAGSTLKPSPSPSPVPYLFSPAASPAGNSRGSNVSPATLDSPGESTGGGRRYSKSRAEAMLEKVRLQPQVKTRDPLSDAQAWGITIWSIDKLHKLFEKVSQDLDKGLAGQISSAKPKANSRPQKIKSRPGYYFLKIEPINRKNRPTYRDLPCWPTINLDSDPGTSPFNTRPATAKTPAPSLPPPLGGSQHAVPPRRQSPRKKLSPTKKVSPTKAKKVSPVKAKRIVLSTRSPKRSRVGALLDKNNTSLNCVPRPPSKRHPNRSPFIDSPKGSVLKPVYEPLTGYCEICKVDYPDLRVHVKTDTHRLYSGNESNYASLDKLINSKAVSIDAFLSLIGANGENTSGGGSSSTVCESSVAAPQTECTQAQFQVIVNTAEKNANMRQPVDDRHIPSKMVGRKESVEVQCNGLSNHTQTRFSCAKVDRENLGNLFLDERISAVQLRKRRAISVSCKDLLELSPSAGERSHFLRSGRNTRSELSQLSPALSDNSHPLLNSNSQQPLLSPALSDKSHHLRTRSQLWPVASHLEDGGAKVTNGKTTGSLLVTANHSDKSSRSEKADRVEGVKTEKGEKFRSELSGEVGPLEFSGENKGSEKEEQSDKKDLENIIVEETHLDKNRNTQEDLLRIQKPESCSKSDKGELEKFDKTEKLETPTEARGKESRDPIEQRELRPTRNHCKNKSIRRKRLSAEEKLIEDNRGYYKVEVLNSKLRSTGYLVNQNQGDELSNGRLSPVCQEESKQNGDMKEPVVVRFKKVRRSELSVLSDEAENFMFGEQTRSETNSEESSDYEEDDECEDDDEINDVDEDEEEDGANANGSEENSGESRSSRRNRRRSSGPHTTCKERPRRIRIKVGGDGAYTHCAPGAGDDGSVGGSSHGSNSESNGHRKHRKRRTQAEAFITDNMDYYKFEMAGSRLRLHGFPNSVPEASDGPQPIKEKPSKAEDLSSSDWEDKGLNKVYSCPVDKLHFSFEAVPSSEVWYQTFQRQDRGEELFFPVIGEPSRVLLPYQVARSDSGPNQRSSLAKRKNKVPVRLPRKSPRCHASTLAILSSLVRRRSREPEKPAVPEEASSSSSSVEPLPDTESKAAASRKVCTQGVSSDQLTSGLSSNSRPDYDEDVQEIARNIDCILGLVPSSSELGKDQEVVEPKSCGKGRGRKKQGQKTLPVNSSSGANNGLLTSDRETDPSLNYLVDPAILEELVCTCDVVSNPHGGPSIDIVSLLNSYSDCCCVLEDSTSTEHGVDASCNSSECGMSCTGEADRRIRKKRKRRNMTGWDKPKRKVGLRRDVAGIQVGDDVGVPLEGDDTESSESPNPHQESSDVDVESHLLKPSDASSPITFVRKGGNKRKLRSSSQSDISPRKIKTSGRGRGRGGYQKVMRLSGKEGEAAVVQTTLNRRGTFRKMKRIGWRKIR